MTTNVVVGAGVLFALALVAVFRWYDGHLTDRELGERIAWYLAAGVAVVLGFVLGPVVIDALRLLAFAIVA